MRRKVPDWVKRHPILGQKRNRLDPDCWQIASEFEADLGNHQLAEVLHRKAVIFAFLLEVVDRLVRMDKSDANSKRDFYESTGVLARVGPVEIRLQVLFESPIRWMHLSKRLLLRKEYLPTRIVNEILCGEPEGLMRG